MISRQDVEKFLISQYGTEIFKYVGFKYIRDIIAGNEDYITGSTVQEYNIVAAEYDVDFQKVERAIRHFKEVLADAHETNTVFINSLIFDFKEWKKKHDKC